MFDAERYLKEFGIPYSTGGKNISPGWLGTKCPFCADFSDHGGFSPEGYYSCWRCGWHSIEDVITRLERLPFHLACQRVAEYQIGEKNRRAVGHMPFKRVSTIEVPGLCPLKELHRRYLIKRRFDPDYLADKYDLRGTGPVGPYRLRLIAPIYFDQEIVSYQGRDVTGQAEIPYKACPKEQEIIEHKTVLYNIDNAQDSTCIVVEGIFDTWRLGDGAVATFGVGFKWAQVNLLATKFKKVFLLYDGEKKAQAKARQIIQALSSLGVEAENILLNQGDPADMTTDQATKLKGELL